MAREVPVNGPGFAYYEMQYRINGPPLVTIEVTKDMSVDDIEQAIVDVSTNELFAEVKSKRGNTLSDGLEAFESTKWLRFRALIEEAQRRGFEHTLVYVYSRTTLGGCGLFVTAPSILEPFHIRSVEFTDVWIVPRIIFNSSRLGSSANYLHVRAFNCGNTIHPHAAASFSSGVMCIGPTGDYLVAPMESTPSFTGKPLETRARIVYSRAIAASRVWFPHYGTKPLDGKPNCRVCDMWAGDDPDFGKNVEGLTCHCNKDTRAYTCLRCQENAVEHNNTRYIVKCHHCGRLRCRFCAGAYKSTDENGNYAHYCNISCYDDAVTAWEKEREAVYRSFSIDFEGDGLELVGKEKVA